MNNFIYPCLWFNHNAKEAANFYTGIFDNSKIISENSTVVMFEINGTKFTGLNGGGQFKPNPAVSYFVYCEGNDEKLEHLYEKLKEQGEVLMPLGKYDWSEKYAWVRDKFGVSWQLDIDPINNAQKIVPALLFANDKTGKVKDAVTYYTSVFEESEKIMEYPQPAHSNLPGDILLFAQFKLKQFVFNAISGGEIKHNFDFSEGNSFVIECDTQEEIDHYWNSFAKEGKESMCGWVQDKYGVWWQIIPSVLRELMNAPEKAQKLSESFLKMKKPDIGTLKKAASQSHAPYSR